MENEKVDTKRAEEWLRSILEMDGYVSTATDKERIEVLLTECSRLASRVAILESALLQAVGEIADYRGVYQDPDTCEQKIAAGVQRRIAEAEKLLAGAHAEEKE